ncbi:MAG: BPL-N domain-containing protein, partial [Methanobacterium sp.]|nr:BPL-N domain-containing protein [Methanobacterium sp.]
LKNISPKTTSKTVLTSRKVIKVVIYNGKGTLKSCVDGVKKCLYISNTKNFMNGYYFSYSTTKTISYSILSHYNVLVMPGGYSGKDYIKTVNRGAIQKFVKNGHGYLGICAGAYAGSRNVDGMYRGWGFAPNVYSKHPYYEGELKVKILDPGIKLFGSNNTVTMAYYNGPAMYVKGGKAVTFANADNNIGYQNYGAIVGDFYYKGRTILSGIHPELDPQHPSILARLVAWTAKISVNNILKLQCHHPIMEQLIFHLKVL